MTSDLQALIPMLLRDPAGNEHPLEIGVDTGFTGYLILPEELLAAVEAPLIGSRVARLADGGRVALDAHLVEVEWNARPRRVVALRSNGRPMIGLSLLYGWRVVLEVVDDGVILIEQLEDSPG